MIGDFLRVKVFSTHLHDLTYRLGFATDCNEVSNLIFLLNLEGYIVFDLYWSVV
jgi:hypothetical protein